MPNVEQTDDFTEEGYVRDAEGNLVPDYDQTIKVFDDGDLVNGCVVKIDRDEILVDIGYKSEGVIPIRELSIRKDVDPNEVVGIGEEIEALVLQKEDKDGRLILSKKRAEYEKSWIRIEELSKSEETISGRVIEVVKGGLILDIGLRGFLPASLVDVRRVRDLHQFVGQDLECKVIEMDRNRNNVVVSRRSVIDDARKQEREKVMSGLKKDKRLTGTVSSIVDFGAFVDLGGIDGLIHISEMSWTHVDHPSEVLEINAEVTVQVLDVDHDRGRISLGLKQCQDDPWKDRVKEFSVSDIVEGRVSKLVSFGAFVEITEGVEGLVHISEIADEHVEKPEEKLTVNETVKAKIVDIDTDRRRVSLSIRQAQRVTPTDEVDDEELEESVDDSVAEEPTKAETKAEAAPEVVLESGDSAEIADEDRDELDAKTSQAIDEALKMNEAAEDETLSGEVEEKQPDTADGDSSLENVVDTMKEAQTGKE